MKTLWILAAAATFAACHNRSDEETGAAPDRGDTTAVSGYDSTAANPNAKIDTTTTTAPSADTSAVSQPTTPSVDTTTQPTAPSADTSAVQPTAPSAGYDTTSTAVPPTTTDTTMSNPSAGAVDTTMSHDSSSTQR
jgi:hypothetical protein